MAYTTNPKLPRLRMQAVLLVRNGWSTREVARHLGYNQSTIVRWVARAAEEQTHGNGSIPTRRSRPKAHPKQLKIYLPYYNHERMHLGIELKRPAELLTQLC